jgi:hypothetical protein
MIRTHVDVHEVGATLKIIVRVLGVQFAEVRQTSSAHPDLKVLVLRHINRWRCCRVSVGVSLAPVRRGADLA